ncbi:MAG: hypothetical protein M1829_005642 [Trizodia sp. TS-e1964]|nr:MAG: hypothetical protein M1829_005642 [Trizodia sp. TS-e1964]
MENSTYARLSHGEGDSGAQSSAASPSSSHQASLFRPLSVDLDSFGGGLFMDTNISPPQQRSSVSSIMEALKLTSGPSYGKLSSSEKDPNVRYPQESVSPDQAENGESDTPPLRRWNTQNSTSLRSITSHTSVPLRHPTPDLQALQGAYVRNVERLERTAEELSMKSDMGKELRKMHLEQKRSESRRSSILASPAFQPVSTQNQSGSVSNSIMEINGIARSGGFSSGGYVSSPRGSIRSGSVSIPVHSVSRASRPAHLPETGKGGNRSESFESPSVPIVAPPKPPPHIQQSTVIPNSAQQEVGPYSANRIGAEGVPLDASERPATADTYQQTSTLFTDFDGIHYAQEYPLPPANEGNPHRLTSDNLLLSSRPISYAPPLPPSDNMVYYPAPVPVMLNLPQKLSRQPPSAVRDKRRSQVIDSLQPSARDSAAWLPGVLEGDDGLGQFREDQFGPKRNTVNLTNPNRRSTHDLSQLPPQLRASVFFDQPVVRQEVEIKEESAVATLESILDASANAPVNAFTDHFIVGHMGAEVYGRTAARRSTSNLDLLGGKPKSSRRQSSMNLLRRRASGNLDLESPASDFAQRRSTGDITKPGQNEGGKAARNSHISLNVPDVLVDGIAQGKGEDVYGDGANDPEEADEQAVRGDLEEEEEEEEIEGDPEYHGPPTTLLAELQLRKQQQKLRTRTAATAFPNGMYSTLLQLDAVAEVQKKSRNQKHITLAWEDTYAHGDASDQDDDEDVPLGVLFPGREGLANRQDRPMGLMEQRDMEDNEPLSRRRTRLFGAPAPAKRASTMFQLEVPHLEGQASGDSGDEEETLAERIKRLKAKGGTTTGLGARPLSHQFSAELTGQFGLSEKEKITSQIDLTSAEPEEETLGQRRRRLQAECEALNQAGPASGYPQQQQKTHSLANLLQAHPLKRASTYQPMRPTDIGTGYIASAGTNTGFRTPHQPEPVAPPVYRGALASNGAMMQALSNTMAYNNIRMGPTYGQQGASPYGQIPGPNMYASRSVMQLGQPPPALMPGDARQRDMVERWRQGVSQ